MKNLTCKIAVAGILLAASAAQAATVSIQTGLSRVSSIEGNAIAANANGSASVVVPIPTVRLAGPGYVDGDTVTLSIGGGGALRLATAGAVADVLPAATCKNANAFYTATPTGTPENAWADGGSINGALRLTVAGVSSSGITYTVGSRDAAVNTADIVCQFSGLQLLASSLTSSRTVTFNWVQSSAVLGTPQDQLRSSEGNPASAVAWHRAGSQFDFYRNSTANTAIWPGSSSVPARTRFAATNTSRSAASPITFATTMTLNYVSVTDGVLDLVTDPTGLTNTAGAANAALVTTDVVRHTYTGDFSFLDNDGNGCTTADFSQGWGRVAGFRGATNTINTSCTTITSTAAAGAETLVFTVGATSAGATAINPQTISVSAEFINNTTGPNRSALAATGVTLALNAFTANIPYMPYGAGISRIVYITNRTTNSGTASFSARNELGTLCPSTSFPTVAVGPSRVALFSEAINTGIAACFGEGWTGKVSIDVTVNGIPQNNGDTFTALGSPRTATDTAVTLANGTVGATDTGSPAVVAGAAAAVAAAPGVLGSIAAAAQLSVDGRITRNAANAEIYSAYNAGGNRVTVVNTSNGR